jgi:hypothetical protein
LKAARLHQYNQPLQIDEVGKAIVDLESGKIHGRSVLVP